jgi:hypothetical protein
MDQVVGCLPGKCEALSSNPSITRRRERERERDRERLFQGVELIVGEK